MSLSGPRTYKTYLPSFRSLPPSPPLPPLSPSLPQVLVDVTGEEFEGFMDLLMQLQYITTAEGVQEVIVAISEQAQLSSDFQVRGGGGDREGGKEGWMDED